MKLRGTEAAVSPWAAPRCVGFAHSHDDMRQADQSAQSCNVWRPAVWVGGLLVSCGKRYENARLLLP